MKYKRILIIGSGGAGKTTFSIKLGKLTSLPVVHLDKLFWLDNWTERGKEEFDALLTFELEKDAWIIDGNFTRTLPLRLKYCDAVILFDYSRLTCVLGVLRRVIRNYGKTRPDMGVNCPERFDLKFLKWVWNYRRETLPPMLDKIKFYDGCFELIIMKNRRQSDKFIKEAVSNSAG